MSYVLKNSYKKAPRLSLATKVLGACVIILSLAYLIFPKAIPALFIALVRPVWDIEGSMKYGELSREELQQEYLAVSRGEAKNNSLIAENMELKSMLGRVRAEKLLLAVILKKPPATAYDSFILDVGTDHKVEAGDRIYALGDIPIGEIAEVFTTTSKARLYSSHGEKFSVLVGPSKIETSAVGKGGGHFEVILPRDTKIQKGDHVLIPSIGDSFLGIVEGVASEASEPFSKILFRQPVNIYEQRFVLIDTNGTR